MACGRELLRDAQMVLRRLARSGMVLQEHDRGGGSAWAVIGRGSAGKRGKADIAGETVAEMHRRGWLLGEPGGGFRISAAGEAWLGARSGCQPDDDRFRRQHQISTDQRTAGGAIRFNETETPLGWLRGRKGADGRPLISPDQFEAGERLRRDFEFAGQSPRITQSWDPAGTAGRGRKAGGRSPAPDPADGQIAARQRFFSAIDMLGPEIASIVVEVCCLGSGLEAAERRLAWPKRSAKLVLQIGLQSLARHYGIAEAERHHGLPRTMQHWAGDGYRPTSHRGQGGR